MISICARIVGFWVLVGIGTAWAAVPLAEVSDDLHQRIQLSEDGQKLWADGVDLRQQLALVRFYSQREYRPAWLNAAGPLPIADDLIKAVAEAGQEGLQAATYHYQALGKLLSLLRTEAEVPPPKWTDLDLLLTDSWLTYASHLLSGRLNPAWAVKSRSRDLVSVLDEALAKGDVAGALTSLSPAHPSYQRLKALLAEYREIGKRGGWPSVSPGPKLVQGMRGPRVKELRARLQATGDPAAKPARTVHEDVFDETLDEAVRHFQRRHGIQDDGVVGAGTLAELNVPVTERIRQIEANMERWRWLPDDFGQRYIAVNVPDFSMAVFENGHRVLEAKVIVGKSVRQTPVFTANMSYLVLSPRWYVPYSIAVKDKLPQLRRDAYALTRQNIRIFDNSGQEIDPGSVDWHAVGRNNFPFRLRQDPGPRNALGRVKFMFPNPFNVYLHDTPSQELFNRNQRTFSSGCIRISKPIELAEYVLKDDPAWNRDSILKASKRGQQRIVNLPQDVPVHILYWTAWVEEDGTVNFRQDIYDRDAISARSRYSV